MSSDIAISVTNLSKSFFTYRNPRDRLVQGLLVAASRVQPGAYLRKLFFDLAVRRRKEFHALMGVNIEIAKGQTVGIIGRNGSGKSTLLQIICGTLAPTSGEATFNGKVAALLELGSGFNPEFTGKENVFLSAQLYGLSKKSITDKYASILEFADIGDFIDQPVKTYSSGMMVRLAFSVIAHVEAEILVIDEALAVGDAFFTQKCMRFLRNFMKTGTVLFVSHDTSSVKSLCSHVIWLDKGRVVAEGDPKEVCELYLNAFLEAQHGGSSAPKMSAVETKGPRNRIYHDQRLKYINGSSLRNDIKLFAFKDDGHHYGSAQALITDVYFKTRDGQPLSWIVGGEEVSLVINCMTHVSLRSPIVGFYVKDRLGQTLFGDNTHLKYQHAPVMVHSEECFEAEFRFEMPVLPAGDYSVCVALADGTQAEHTQHHWVHDALLFRSESSSVSTGLLGIPMHQISLSPIKIQGMNDGNVAR